MELIIHTARVTENCSPPQKTERRRKENGSVKNIGNVAPLKTETHMEI